MKKQTRRKQRGLHPLIKQGIRGKWSSEAMLAQIHALNGEDKDRLLAHGSVMFFVAAGCAKVRGWTGDEPDMRIVRASVNALDDLKSRPAITDLDRGAIHSGMLAAHRIIKDTDPGVVNDCAIAYEQHSQAWQAANTH